MKNTNGPEWTEAGGWWAGHFIDAPVNDSTLEGGGSIGTTTPTTSVGDGPPAANMNPGAAPKTSANPTRKSGTQYGADAFAGNKQTPYGPAGQYPAMAQNMGGQSGFVPAPNGGGSSDFGQNGMGGYDIGADFGPVDDSVQIQQDSQPAKPGILGGSPSSGFGPYPAMPWQQ